MCMLSMVMDYGRKTWPQEAYPIFPNTQGVYIPPTPTAEQWADFMEVVEKARKFDEMTGQADCEDPAKGQWMSIIEQRLTALEKKQ